MPQADRVKRWESSELIKILTFLNNNFDLWYKNHQDACVEAVKAVNINRDGKSVYNKVHSMIKAMEHFLRTRRKPKTCFIIRENKIIRGLVKEICYKTREKNGRENQDRNNDGDIEMAANNNQSTITRASQNRINVPRMPFSMETIDEIYNEQIKRIDRSMLISKKLIETRNREIRDLYEQISKRRTELIELIEKANNKLEMLKVFT